MADLPGPSSITFAAQGARKAPSREKLLSAEMRPLSERHIDDDRASLLSDAGSHASVPEGVRRLEATASAWTKTSLLIAYASLYLMAFSTSLETQTTVLLTPRATSAFKAHALLATVAVVQSVVYSVVKPIMAKVSDVFGRLEAFSICVFLYVCGYVMLAASNNIKTYAASAIFYAAGGTGLQLLQQIFIADTSDLLNRALMSTIPDIPFLFTVWLGPVISSDFISQYGWRWGYGIWAVILPIAFAPLALSLWFNAKKAEKQGLLQEPSHHAQKAREVINSLWYELDIGGLILLCAAISLILIPLTLAAGAEGGWTNPSILTMISIGIVCLLIFPFWERSHKLAPRAFFPPALLKHATVLAGLSIAFFYFMAFYLSVFPYFYSYLIVVSGQDAVSAGRITLTFTFTCTVTAVIVSLLIKRTKHYKFFITAGAAVYMLGIGLMRRFRNEDASTFTLVGCQILTGIGGGMVNVPVQLGVQASAKHADVASATAIFLTVLEIGGAVGAAISGAVWSYNLLPKLEAYLPPESRANATHIFEDYLVAAHGWPRGSPTHQAISRAYQETMSKLLTIAVLVCIPLIPLSLMMKNYKLDEVDQHVKGNVIGSDFHDNQGPEHDHLTGRHGYGSNDEDESLAAPRPARGPSIFDKSRPKNT